MAVSKKLPSPRINQAEPVGLAAIASSGSWEIAVDQTTSGRNRWFAQIESPLVSLYFELNSPDMIDRAIRFFSEERAASNSEGNSTLNLGASASTEVNLIRDDEFEDRFFFAIEAKGGIVVRLTLTGENVSHILNALHQVRDELTADLCDSAE